MKLEINSIPTGSSSSSKFSMAFLPANLATARVILAMVVVVVVVAAVVRQVRGSGGGGVVLAGILY